MKKIPVEQIADGMVLAQPVTGPSGNVLLAAGAQLKASLAGRLSGYGVQNIFIEGEGDQIATPENFTEDIEARLQGIFTGKLNNPHMQMIFEMVLHHRREHR